MEGISTSSSDEAHHNRDRSTHEHGVTPPPHEWAGNLTLTRRAHQSNLIPVHHDHEGFRYFGSPALGITTAVTKAPERPLNVVVLTSIRDIGLDDRVGQHVEVNHKGYTETRYMKGALEGLIEATGSSLKPFIKLVGIVIDDVYEKDGVEAGGYSILPHRDAHHWIMPMDYRTPEGDLVSDMVIHAPSAYRKLPRSLASERATQKLEFEKRVETLCRKLGADIILSDHLMVVMEHLHHGFYAGKVLNIHPGITWAGDPNSRRGMSPSLLAMQRANGYETTEDGQHRKVTPYYKAGASLHYVDDVVDGGQVICDAERTEVRDDFSRQTIRHKTYKHSKIPVLTAGFRHYVSNFYPTD